MLYKQVGSADRLAAIKVNGAESALDIAVHAAAEIFKAAAGSIAIVGSGRNSVEEQFLAKKLAAAVGATTHLVSHVGEGDKILISADRTPNVRGALVTGLVATLPSRKLTELAAAIEAGKVKAILSLGEDLISAGLTPAQVAKVSVVYLGTHANTTSAVARVVFPTPTVFEKNGTFVNQQFRIQKFQKAIPASSASTDDLVVLAKLIAAAGGPNVPAEINALWKVIASDLPALGPMTFANIPGTGLLLDRSPWANLPFVEGETLHYKPSEPVPPPANSSMPAPPRAGTPT
jgi:NADH-quinone oxidoreductase subunit G